MHCSSQPQQGVHSPLSPPPLTTRRLSKEAINALPLGRWEGPTCLVSAPEQVAPATRRLQTASILGFDTETRPAFRKGQRHLPSLLQLATKHEVFLFQLKRTGLPQEVISLLSNQAIVKAGVAPRDDVLALQEFSHFTPAGFVDLASLGRNFQLRHFGLRGLAAVTMGIRIAKSKKISNWAKDNLSPGQLVYAATDAWAGREIYLRLSREHAAHSTEHGGKKKKGV